MKQKTKKTIELVNFLNDIINKKKLLKSNQSLILAISGGQDSITLFFIFLQLKEQWNWKLKIIYCNHLWQKDSFYTILHLFKLAYLFNIPIYFTFTLQKILTEQLARNWRSLTFQRITEFYLVSTIITGHSKSDRVETGLFNMFRGSSTKGVSSLNWTKLVLKKGIQIIFKYNKKAYNLFCSLLSEEKDAKCCEMETHLASFSSERREQKPIISQIILTHNLKNYNNPNIFGGKQYIGFQPILKYNSSLLKQNNLDYFVLKITRHIFNRNYNEISNRQHCLQLKQFLQYYLQFVWSQEKIIGAEQSANHTPNLLLTNLSVKCSTRFFPTPRNNFVIKKFYICKVNCIKCKDIFYFFVKKKISLKKNHQDDFFLTDFYSFFSNEKRLKPSFSLFFCKKKKFCRAKVKIKKKKNSKNHQQRFLLLSCTFFCKKKYFFKPIFYKSEYILVRPLLSLTRFDLKKICNSWKIPLFPDQSNQKYKYQRNRIRKQILPTLRFFFNPQIDTTLFQFIEILNNEQEYMDFLTACIVKEIQYKKQTIVELEKSLFAVLPIPLRRKVIKQFLEKTLKKSTKFFDIERFLQQLSISSFLISQKNIKIKQHAEKKEKHMLKKKNVSSFFFKGFIVKDSQNTIQPLQNREFELSLYRKEIYKQKKLRFRFATKKISLLSLLKKDNKKDVLINLINQKKILYKEHKYIFFPKVSSIFLQSQRIFFIKKS